MPHNIPIHLIEQHHKYPNPETVRRAVALHEGIRDVLGSEYDTFLQGSYKNDTSTPNINDVDIVAIRKNTYSGTFSPSPQNGSRPLINWNQIFTEIESKIQNSAYAPRLLPRGDKCVKIGGGMKADIIPAVAHTSPENDPMVVYSFRDRTERLNYPRIHYLNGVNKHDRTEGMYKPTVRMFKNWAEIHFQDNKVTPSFFMESAVHNAPDNLFSSDMAINFVLVGNDIANRLYNRQPIYTVSGHKNILDEWDAFHVQNVAERLRLAVDLAHEAVSATSIADATDKWKRAFLMS